MTAAGQVRNAAAILLIALIAAALAGCGSAGRELDDPTNVAFFEPITESGDFRAETELILHPDPEQDGAGQGSLAIRITSLSGRELRNLKATVYFPPEMVDTVLLLDRSLQVPFSREPLHVGPDRPSFVISQGLSFPNWDQVEEVKEAVLNPILLRLVWDNGERYLAVPASEIKVRQLDAVPDALPQDGSGLG